MHQGPNRQIAPRQQADSSSTTGRQFLDNSRQTAPRQQADSFQTTDRQLLDNRQAARRQQADRDNRKTAHQDMAYYFAAHSFTWPQYCLSPLSPPAHVASAGQLWPCSLVLWLCISSNSHRPEAWFVTLFLRRFSRHPYEFLHLRPLWDSEGCARASLASVVIA